MKGLRLVLATGLITAALGVSPAHATKCDESNPKDDCGGCEVNWKISKEDPRPVVCYF
ncbi:MAG TPA: hypothetical protein VEU29_02180 [Actinomycetota bacterium]|nr:hypothetical protein [Actinomycetota bacterium]